MDFITSNKLLIFILIIILLSMLTFAIDFNKVKAYGYQGLRSLHKSYLDYKTADFYQIEKNNFSVKYTGIPKETAQLVLETGQEVFNPVSELLGYAPSGKIPVIVYPTKEALNKSFGWEGDKSAMGVYWMGTIRILAPEAWLEGASQEEKAVAFKTMGPMAHEFAHLVVDYKTKGNYTRWFTEGIAQYAEKELIGFILDEPTQKAKANIYSFSQLDSTFDDQPDQELAYWQSLVAIEYLIEKYQPEVLQDLLNELALGNNLDNAFRKVLGYDTLEFESILKEYINESLLENAA
ncbi:MAG: hypothetical protein GX923_02950 [Clostridia bacterium]|nr:hypothetical protein [Clostridia bacterium]